MNRKVVDGVETTAKCPECGCTNLVKCGTQNLKLCPDCPTNIVWLLTPGQVSIYGGPSTLVE